MNKMICIVTFTVFLLGCSTYSPPLVVKGPELSRKKTLVPKDFDKYVKIIPVAMDKNSYSVMATTLSPDGSKLIAYAIKTPDSVIYGGMHMALPLAKESLQYLNSAIANTISGVFSAGLTGGTLGLGAASFSQGIGALVTGLVGIAINTINPPQQALFIWKWPDLKLIEAFIRKEYIEASKKFGFVGPNSFFLYPSTWYSLLGFNITEENGAFEIKNQNWTDIVKFDLKEVTKKVFSKKLKPNYCVPVAMDGNKLFLSCSIYKKEILRDVYYSSILVFDTKTKSVISKIGPYKEKEVDFVLPIPKTNLAFIGYWEQGFIRGKASVYLIDYSNGKVDKAMSDMLRSPETFLITGHVKGVVPVDVRISQDGSKFALLAATSSGVMDKFKISLYDLTTGERIADVKLPSSIGLPISWGFYKDNHRLVLATPPRVYLIDPDSGIVYDYLTFSKDVIKTYFKECGISCFNYLTFTPDKKKMIFPMGSSVVIVDTVGLESEGKIKPISAETINQEAKKLKEELREKEQKEKSTKSEDVE